MSQPQQSTDLAVLRTQIDSLDQQLLTLLNQRALVAEQVGELSAAKALPSSAPTALRRLSKKYRVPTRAPC